MNERIKNLKKQIKTETDPERRRFLQSQLNCLRLRAGAEGIETSSSL